MQTKLISVARAQSSCCLSARRVDGGQGGSVDDGGVDIYLSLTKIYI